MVDSTILYFLYLTPCVVLRGDSPQNRPFRGEVCSRMCVSPQNRPFRGQLSLERCVSPRNQRFRGEVSLFDAKIVRTKAIECCSVEGFLVVRVGDADECLCTLLH